MIPFCVFRRRGEAKETQHKSVRCPDAKATHLTSPHHQKILPPGEVAQGRERERAPAPGRNSPTPPRPPCACPRAALRCPHRHRHHRPPSPPPSLPTRERPTSAMRIRRYAARLLLSSTSATTAAAPSTSPPRPRPPAAPWLHADDEDWCAFCELSRPAPQVTRSLSPPPSSPTAALFRREGATRFYFVRLRAGVVTVGLCLLESQEGQDAIKLKGHIAGRVPESDVRADERVGLPQRTPAPEGISVQNIICVYTVVNANAITYCPFWCSMDDFS